MEEKLEVRGMAVSGSFYASDAGELKAAVNKLLKSAKIEEKVAGTSVSFVAPHAGYIYSGGVAGFTYRAISARLARENADTFVIIGPNHTGLGAPLSLSAKNWLTPLGLVENDIGMTREISRYSDSFSVEDYAHLAEHSIEAQLPFLQSIVHKPRCVFLCMGDQSYEASVLVSKAIDHAKARLNNKVIVIASSDFNHYEPAKTAEEKDMPAIEAACRLDAEAFHKLIASSGDSACGYGPITASILYSKSNGAKSGYLLKYSNSGEATKDYNSVVAYVSMAFA